MDEQYIEQLFEDGGSTRTMDVDVVDMSGERWTNKGAEVFNGIVDGFQLLHSEVSLIEGSRVTLHDLDHEFTGDNSWDDLDSALGSQGFDDPKHYHMVYDGQWPPSKIGSHHSTATDDGTIWNDENVKGISGLSLQNTWPLPVSAYTRGFHQLMHNYINETIATEYADSDDGYTAVHQLGTSQANIRTIMADIYPHHVTSGDYSGSFWWRWRAPTEGTFAFSECTLTAIKDSIHTQEGHNES